MVYQNSSGFSRIINKFVEFIYYYFMTSDRARNWIITYQIPENDVSFSGEDWLRGIYEKTKANYVVGQMEHATTTFRRHMQVFINTKTCRFSFMKKHLDNAHIEICKDRDASEEYCKKEKTRLEGPWTFGVYPFRKNNKKDWDQIFLHAKRGEIDKIPSQVVVQNYSNLTKIARDHLPKYECSHLRGIFIFGQSGIGKSTLARSLFPNLDVFTKAPSKWFDSYQGEKVIIWDDIDPELGHKFSTNLKLFTDRYPVVVETKGSSISLRHDYFIITSQYPFEQVFVDLETRVAMERRCYIFNMWEDTKLGVNSKFSFIDLEKKLKSTLKPDIDKFILKD